MTNVLARKAVLASLTMSQWGARKSDETVTDDVLDRNNAERDAGLFTKRLLKRDSMQDIHKVARKAAKYHGRHTQPWFDDGVRILPTVLYMEYAKKMGELKNEFEAAVDVFVSEYPKYVKEAQKVLGKLFSVEDYPEAHEVKKRFALEVIILPCPDVADFRVALDKEDLDEIRKNLDKRLQTQLKTATASAAKRIAETVGNMATRLKEYKPADKGKNKKAEGRFHDSLIEHVRELADLLPAFNLDDDPKLAAVHKRIVKELCAHEPDMLREDEAVRKQVAKSAKEIVDAVADFMA